MADVEAEAPGERRKVGGLLKKAVAVLALVAVVAGGTVAFFKLGGVDAIFGGESKAPTRKGKNQSGYAGTSKYHELDGMLVGLRGTDTRVRIELRVVVKTGAGKSRISQVEPHIYADVRRYLAGLKPDAFRGPEDIKTLRRTLTERIQTIAPNVTVKGILFEEYLVL